jgi:hypothetical protein
MGVPLRSDWRVADGVRVEELDGSWLALDPTGGVVYRLEARAAEVMRRIAHRLPLPGHLVPAARELAGHGVLEHPLVDRRTAMVGAGVVTLTGLAATLLPSAAAAASTVWTEPGDTWVASGGLIQTQPGGARERNYYVHVFRADGTLTVTGASAIDDLSILVVAGGGGGGGGLESAGGGGGAGGVLEVTSAVLPNGSYIVTVGAGGAGKTGSSGPGNKGSDTSLVGAEAETGVNLTVLGGGAGGGFSFDAIQNGGSGGGGGATSGSGNINGGSVGTVGRSGTIPTGTVSAFAGFNGGSGANDGTGLNRRAGGGGGAGGIGVSGVANSTAGAGGSSIEKPSYVLDAGEAFAAIDGHFAGGGGGAGGENSVIGARGSGGGATAGNGGYGDNSTGGGGDAGANTGSGGGGATRGQDGGDGGSGIVLVRYRLA